MLKCIIKAVCFNHLGTSIFKKVNQLKIATRNSPLALWQAEHVKQRLIQIHPNLDVELVGIQTEGDRFLEAPLVAVGGKGLFIKELEQSLLDNKADIAVHSMKDVTIDLPEKLILPVILKREDARDVLISRKYGSLKNMAEGSIVGTSSLRRQSQIRAIRPDLELKDLRGNVGTRLRKLENNEYDAIILAAAGINRLGLSEIITEYIPRTELLPAIGQGAIGIECRLNDSDVLDLISPLNDHETALCVQTERSFSARLYGGCQLPIAGHASISGNEIKLVGLVARLDGSELIISEHKGNINETDAIGITLAESLLERGADEILKELVH